MYSEHLNFPRTIAGKITGQEDKIKQQVKFHANLLLPPPSLLDRPIVGGGKTVYCVFQMHETTCVLNLVLLNGFILNKDYFFHFFPCHFVDLS